MSRLPYKDFHRSLWYFWAIVQGWDVFTISFVPDWKSCIESACDLINSHRDNSTKFIGACRDYCTLIAVNLHCRIPGLPYPDCHRIFFGIFKLLYRGWDVSTTEFCPKLRVLRCFYPRVLSQIESHVTDLSLVFLSYCTGLGCFSYQVLSPIESPTLKVLGTW